LSWIALVNIFVFSLSNGVNASNSYMICSDYVKKEYKHKFGAAIGSFLSLGYFVGSLFASLVVEKYFI